MSTPRGAERFYFIISHPSWEKITNRPLLAWYICDFNLIWWWQELICQERAVIGLFLIMIHLIMGCFKREFTRKWEIVSWFIHVVANTNYFLLWDTKVDVLQIVHAALFNTVEINGNILGSKKHPKVAHMTLLQAFWSHMTQIISVVIKCAFIHLADLQIRNITSFWAVLFQIILFGQYWCYWLEEALLSIMDSYFAVV